MSKSFAWVGARLRPLRQKLRRRHVTPRNALAALIGAELAETFVHGLERARFASAAVPHEERKLRVHEGKQRVYGPRYAARVRVESSKIRDESAPEVIGAVCLLLCVLDQVRPGQCRAWHKSLWLGRADTSHEHAGGLASQLGVCVRTLQRWFAALRTVGAFKNWQPPGKDAPEHARTRKGRAYTCYALPVYGETWAAWQAQAVKASARTSSPGTSSPGTSSRPPGSESRSSRFLAMVPPLPD